MGLPLCIAAAKIARFPKADHKARWDCLSAFIEIGENHGAQNNNTPNFP